VVRSRKRALLAEQRASWDEGRPVPPEEILRRWPTDPAKDPDAASLLVEDYFQRRRRGDELSLDHYHERFPDHSRSMAAAVTVHRAFREAGDSGSVRPPRLRLPDVGDEVFGFRMQHPLGKGSFARVFLAGQGLLADRPVVLKISAIEGTEPQTLAQLQHTNIVPIDSVHEDPDAGLRAICMPYLGGASLSEVIKELFATNPAPKHGREFVDALKSLQASIPDRSPGQGGAVVAGPSPLDELRVLDYPRTAIWISARLAEGLQHAHQRGVLHRDIKPSNILIGADGQPLLLDFNLAHDRNIDVEQATIGGTIAYMAPEHLRALLRQTPELAQQVDQRSDIYSLGMVIAEILTGFNPFQQSASYSAFPLQIEAMALERSKRSPSVRETRPDVPWGLESVVRKCLHPDPDSRYQQADQLAEDLRRLLDDRSLRYAPELSQAARFRQISNLMAFPVLNGVPVGWLVALNRKPGPASDSPDSPVPQPPLQTSPFRRGDAAMLAPFASLLGYHARASQRYSQVRELLIGLTRSLTAAIDAKDSYTFGHSERVARIAVELGRELGLPEDELSDIYLAGLLHDIGKIGIRDEVLGKQSKLDDDEFEHIRQHVTIGYQILSGLTSISHLLPGVLYHHERYDGRGYPEGLKGNAIPFIARVLAVADSYDAMSTSRPYRVAMAADQVERILIEGIDTQWERVVIEAFIRCKDRVHVIRQRGVGESLCGALDDVLRNGKDRRGLSSMVNLLVY